MNPDTLPDEPSDYKSEPSEESQPSELDEPSDLDLTDMPCTDADTDAGDGDDADESPWEAFLPDDDEWDPVPEPGDFWIEDRLLVSPSTFLLVQVMEGRTMLALSMVKEIDRLLNEGELSRRQIAERLKVSRGTVSAIANGQRGLHGRTPEDEAANETPTLPAERCPKCGFLVHKPCLVCRTREYRQGRRVLAALAVERSTAPRPRRRLPLRRRRHRTCRVRVA